MYVIVDSVVLVCVTISLFWWRKEGRIVGVVFIRTGRTAAIRDSV
jgi:hypothetical protein